MVANRTRSALRTFVATSVLCLAVPSPPASAQGLFDALFSAFGLRPPTEPPPAWLVPARPAPRSIHRRRLPKAQAGGLPAARASATSEPPLQPEGGLVARILHDSTLRRGDIVVFPTGAKVFNGEAGGFHTLADFDDIQSSKFVGEATRRYVMSSTGMVAAAGTVQTASASLRRHRRSARRDVRDVATTGSVAGLDRSR